MSADRSDLVAQDETLRACPGVPANTGRSVVLSDLGGLWRRTLLVLPNGRSDSSSRVWWLQGPRTFVDLRLPAHADGVGTAARLDELDWEDCLALSRQEGFAGHLEAASPCFEWQRVIDYQPPSGHADAGFLDWQEELLVERGRDIGYLEHWQRTAFRGGVRAGAVQLRDPAQHQTAFLVWHGPFAMYARSRPPVSFKAPTLHECVSGCDSLGEARRLLDCEVSYGRLEDGALLIEASTLPYRRGQRLRMTLGSSIATLQTHADRVQRRWEIQALERTSGGHDPALVPGAW